MIWVFLLISVSSVLAEPNVVKITSDDFLIVEGAGPRQEPATNRELRAGKNSANSNLIDFNCDGKGDLAAASPRIDIGSAQDAGAINYIFGGANGLSRKGNRQLHLNRAGVPGTAQAGDLFGTSLAAGDFDGDRCTDLLIGASGSRAVYISNAKAKAFEVQTFSQPDGVVFGNSVAAGDFDGDGDLDFAVGDPGATVNGKTFAGRIYTFYNSAGSFVAGDPFDLDTAGVKGAAKTNGLFAQKLYAFDIDFDGRDDLISANPSENNSKGSTNILYGAAQGLSVNGNQRIRVRGGKAGDFFSFAVSALFWDKDKFVDLIFTIPGRNNNTGGAFILRGKASGITSKGSAFLLNPAAAPGDRWGFAVDSFSLAAGNSFVYVGAPGTDLVLAAGVQTQCDDCGSTNLIQINGNAVQLIDLNGEEFPANRCTAAELGKSVAIVPEAETGAISFAFSVAAACSSCDGGAGSVVEYRIPDPTTPDGVPIDPDIIKAGQAFNLDNLKGSDQGNATFASGLSVALLCDTCR